MTFLCQIPFWDFTQGIADLASGFLQLAMADVSGVTEVMSERDIFNIGFVASKGAIKSPPRM